MATLAAVEDSHPDIYVRIDNDDPTKPVDPNEAELAAAAAATTPHKPITSKLRTTIKHLRARAGFWSRFRGFSMYMAWAIAQSFVVALVPVPMTSFVGQFFVQSIASVLFSTWKMAWVHIVISEPSPRRFYQRIPSYRAWIKIAPAAALENVLASAAFFLPMALAHVLGWVDTNPKQEDVLVALYRFLAVMVLPFLLAFLISVPARVIFIRVAASMLPEEDETIVPFDRSFGGKVQPSIVGGSGKIGLLDAWKTFDWDGRVRFVKVALKTAAIEVAIVSLAVLLVVGQFALMPKETLPGRS